MSVNPGLVVTHGDLGTALIRLAELIMGPVEGLDCLSNHGLSGHELNTRIQEWLANDAAATAEGVVVFVDDFGGSCATGAQLASHNRSDVVILSGVNLAMILGFLTWRDTLELSELARKLVETGRGAINRIEICEGGENPA